MKESGLLVFKLATVFVIAFFALVLVTPAMVLTGRGLFVDGELYEELGSVVAVSILTSSVSASFSVLVSIPVSFYFARFVAGVPRRLLLSLFMIPALVSPSAVGSLLLLFFTENPVGRFLNTAFRVVNDLKGVVVAQFVVTFPLTFSYYVALFASVPRVYEEVAMEMGLTRLGYLYRVLIPMTRNQVVSGYVLSFARAFADFGASLILGGGIRGRTWTLPIYVFAVTQLGGLAVLALVLLAYTLISFVAYLILAEVSERL